jgi:hypothetical protein
MPAVRVGAGLALVAVTAAIAATAATVWAADPVVSASASDAPDPVSAGLVATYAFDLVNDSNPTLTNTDFVALLPAGSTLASGSFSTTEGGSGSCSEAAGTVTCAIGSLNGGADAAVVLELVAPAAAFEVCGSFSFKEGTHEGDPAHLDTVTACSSSDVRPADDPDFRGGCIDPGDTISTGSAATSTDRQNTAVTVAGEACVVVAETIASGPSEACGTGFSCITEISEIVLPPCSVTDPCTVTLTFDKSFGKVRRVFKDGALVAPCDDPAQAAPDPCVVSKTQLKGGDTRFVVNFAIDARMRGG